MFFNLEKFFVKREDLCRASCTRRGELIRRVRQDLLEMPGCCHLDLDCGLAQSLRAQSKIKNSKSKTCPERSRRSLRSRSRNASSCCRGWDAGCREVPPPSSYCRDILRAREESCLARLHQDSVLPFEAARRGQPVATLPAIELQWAAPSRRSSRAVPGPLRTRSHSAIPEHCRARRSRAIFETRLAQCPVRASRVAEKIVSETGRSGAECPACAAGAQAPQFEKCLADSTNRSATGSLRAPAQSAGWLRRSPESLLSWSACCREADTRAPAARAKNASVDPSACRRSHREKACRHWPLRSFLENRSSRP